MPLLLLLAVFVTAIFPTQSSPDDSVRSVAATPTDGTIAVDGRLDEAVWKAAVIASDFVQFEPDEGAPASFDTEVRVLYGPSALYVGAVMHDPEPDRIRRPLSRRDEEGGAALFVVGIDGYLDQRTAYLFAVTAAGVQLDGAQSGNDTDESWDAVWDSAVRVTPEGWVAELAIPYSMLRFSQASEQTWGIQFQRTIPRRSEEAYWQPVTREEQGIGFISGRLTGLRGISPRQTLQVRPYTLSRARTFESDDRPGTTEATLGADVGADLKIGLASNLILDATINPDFGQVDADPAVLNLSTFEIFFSERRPFFLEGTAIFDYTIDSGRDGRLLYTRRIGADSPIIGAAKLTGRTSGGLSVGGLASVTGADLAPERFFGAARVKQEFSGRSAVGLGLTYADYIGTSAPRVGRRALLGGGDWDIRLGDGTYRWDGAATASYRTSPSAVDLGVPSETGFAIYTGLDKIRGNTTWGSGVRVYSDAFRADDLGRLREADLIRLGLGGGRYLNGGNPIGPFRRVRISLFGDQTWSYAERVNRGFSGSVNAEWEFMNFSELGLSVSVGGVGGFDVRETRGLGPIRNRRTVNTSVSYGTDSRRQLRLEPGAGFSFGEDGALGWDAGLEVAWTVSDRVDLSLDAEYGSVDGRLAWAANEAFLLGMNGAFIGATDGTPDPEFVPFDDGGTLAPTLNGLEPFDARSGAYYLPVFGARDTRELDLALRTNVTFHPNLSLQLYTQLFAARGRFRDIRLLADADDLRPFDAYPKRRDFSIEALLSNAVLRWEYRPGSTLFVVWSHTRHGENDTARFLDEPGDSPFATPTLTQLGDTFEIYPENVFLVKLSYLLMR